MNLISLILIGPKNILSKTHDTLSENVIMNILYRTFFVIEQIS